MLTYLFVLLLLPVSDMALARRTFAGVTSNLTLLASRLTTTSSPCPPPSPAPAIPLPHWLGAPSTNLRALSRRRSTCGGSGDGSHLCHQLAAVLPDPWAACFASAHRAFRLCEENEQEEGEGDEEEKGNPNGGTGAEMDDEDSK